MNEAVAVNKQLLIEKKLNSHAISCCCYCLKIKNNPTEY